MCLSLFGKKIDVIFNLIVFRMEQARKWLSNPGHDDKGLGRRAIALIVEEGRKVSTIFKIIYPVLYI